MKNSIAFVLIFTFITIDVKSQDLLNPYDVSEYQFKPLNLWKYESDNSTFEYFFEKPNTGFYNGEYQVFLEDHFWYGSNILTTG